MTYKNCQSCGMPLKRDEGGGGTETDGAKSAMYCSKCYRDGQFINPEMTVDQMVELVKGKMKEMHFPGLLAWVFTRNIPKLKRWSNTL